MPTSVKVENAVKREFLTQKGIRGSTNIATFGSIFRNLDYYFCVALVEPSACRDVYHGKNAFNVFIGAVIGSRTIDHQSRVRQTGYLRFEVSLASIDHKPPPTTNRKIEPHNIARSVRAS